MSRCDREPHDREGRKVTSQMIEAPFSCTSIFSVFVHNNAESVPENICE